MARRRFPNDFYWPLGGLGFGDEIAEVYPEEASLLGAITILWNYHEDQLRAVFLRLMASPHETYAGAVWDRQPTHQAKRNLLALALEHRSDLTPLQRTLLSEVLEGTKRVADRRNELLHGIYMVHGNTQQVFAVSQSPNSTKPPRYHKSSVKDLRVVLADLERMISVQGYLAVSLIDPDGRMIREIGDGVKTWRNTQPSPAPGNPESGSPPPSARPKRASKPKLPPQS